MAGIAPAPESTAVAYPSSRHHFAAITWLRWRIFRNSLLGKGAAGELIAKILSYPLLAILVLGPAVGTGFASYYLVDSDQVSLLTIPLWIIFLLWQFIGVSTSASGPAFDLSSLIRFPIRYRDYLLMRLSFGLLDPPTLAGIACLIAMGLAIAIAAPTLFPFSAITLILYAICNIFFSRMVYAWLERWLAQRRTRELVTGLILVCSLLIQFITQYFQRFDRHGHHAVSPWMVKTADTLIPVNWFLPPGLAAAALDHAHSGNLPLALASLTGLLIFTLGFLIVLHLRLHAQFLGENLSEAPAVVQRKSTAAKAQAIAAAESSPAPLSFLPTTVAACLVKEIRYLLRSGPKLYVLVMPVFVVLLFSMRTAGLNYYDVSRRGVGDMLFSYGCAYTMLIFVSLIYNSLGGDGAGVQFYFVSPLRLRDVMLAKNLLTAGIFLIEAIALYIATAVIARPTPLALTAATLAWSAFTLLLNMAIGNVRSIRSPKVLDVGKVRSQNVSGLNSLISLAVVFGSVLLGALVMTLCRYMQISNWVAAAIFAVLAVLSGILYAIVLQKIDEIAAANVESLTAALSKV